jgi:hypothetical protein
VLGLRWRDSGWNVGLRAAADANCPVDCDERSVRRSGNVDVDAAHIPSGTDSASGDDTTAADESTAPDDSTAANEPAAADHASAWCNASADAADAEDFVAIGCDTISADSVGRTAACDRRTGDSARGATVHPFADSGFCSCVHSSASNSDRSSAAAPACVCGDVNLACVGAAGSW